MEARGVMVKVMGNGLVAPSSNPGRGNCISLQLWVNSRADWAL